MSVVFSHTLLRVSQCANLSSHRHGSTDQFKCGILVKWCFVDFCETSYKHGLRLSSSIVLAAPALDLDFLLNIIHEKRPLDWEAVLKSDVPLKVVASCLDTLQPVILENFTSAQDLETCLRASANVPEVSPEPLGAKAVFTYMQSP